MSDKYEETFYLVPSYIRKLPNITLGYMDVYNIIFQFWNKGRQCYLKNKTFAERTGHDIRRIQEALAYFEAHGELERITHDGKRYLVRPTKKVQVEEAPPSEEENINIGGVRHSACGGCGTAHVGGAAQRIADEKPTAPEATAAKGSSEPPFSRNKEVLNKEILIATLCAGDEKSSPVYDDLIFNQMWDAYPHKVNKHAALKAFKKIFKGKDGVDHENLLKEVCDGFRGYIEQHNAWRQMEAQGADIWFPKLKQLDGWLNGRKWEDEHQTAEQILRTAKRKKTTGVDLAAREQRLRQLNNEE